MEAGDQDAEIRGEIKRNNQNEVISEESTYKVNSKEEADYARQKAAKLEFSVDLIQGAFAHLEFLRTINEYPCLFEGPYLKRALQRYEKLWLPLAAENSTEILAAPLDIEWAWHCHVLAPHFYRNDCKTFYGKLINHRLMRSSERNEKLINSKELWEKKYPNEQFEVFLPIGCYYDNIPNNFQSKLSYDIEGASARQGTFYYNVSLPHFLDEKYLNFCVLRYKKFLYLKLNTNDAFLVPCYDNDLIWHTHQLFSRIYYEDTCRILGSLYNHDDSTTDRSPGSKLSVAYANTRDLWKNMFYERYSFPGAMYRGVCSKGRLTKYTTNKKTDNLKIKVQFNFIALSKIPDCCEKSKFKMKILYGFLKNSNDEKEEIMSLKGDLTLCDGSKHFEFVFDEKKHEYIKFRLIRKSGIVRQQDKVVCEGDIDIKSLLGNTHSDFGIVFQNSLVLKGVEDLTVYFTGQIRYMCDPYRLYLRQGHFQRVHKPSSLEEVVLTDSLVENPGARCCECEAARHSFVNNNQTVFECVVLHSASSNYSAVQVVKDDKVLTVGTLIDSSHLPLPAQISPWFCGPTLSPTDGERAFLIKDDDGDWAVVVGKWVKSDSGPDAFQIVIYNNRSGGHLQKLVTTFKKEDCILRINHCQIDLRKGCVMFDIETDDIPQFIALTFAIGILHVLCVPRPTTWKPGDSVDTDNTKHVRSGDLPFVLASGLKIQTPCNHYRLEKK